MLNHTIAKFTVFDYMIYWPVAVVLKKSSYIRIQKLIKKEEIIRDNNTNIKRKNNKNNKKIKKYNKVKE